MFIIYDIVFFIFSILYLPYLLIKRKWHDQFCMRFGILPKEISDNSVPSIWIHAVSVGEVFVIKNLLTEIRTHYPDEQIVISVVTQTGFQMAQKIAKDNEKVIYAPLDFSFTVSKYISVIKPRIFVNAETELWPNLLSQLYKRNIPIVQVNGRISDKAFSGYKTFRFFIRPIIKMISCFCMQSEQDANRIKELGAPSERIQVVGNIKFDDVLSFDGKELPDSIVDSEEDLLIAGSTHSGEEEIVLDIFRKLKKKFSHLRLVIAPRHPERANEIIELVEQKKFKAIKFSQIHDLIVEQNTVVVVDTIGHLRALYRLGKIVFVGKSLTAQGGHNIIEPAYFAKPVIVGPYMQNFRDVTQLFLKHEAILQVKNKSELLSQMTALLKDENKCEDLGLKAKEVVEQYRGATEKTFDVILGILEK